MIKTLFSPILLAFAMLAGCMDTSNKEAAAPPKPEAVAVPDSHYCKSILVSAMEGKHFMRLAYPGAIAPPPDVVTIPKWQRDSVLKWMNAAK